MSQNCEQHRNRSDPWDDPALRGRYSGTFARAMCPVLPTPEETIRRKPSLGRESYQGAVTQLQIGRELFPNYAVGCDGGAVLISRLTRGDLSVVDVAREFLQAHLQVNLFAVILTSSMNQPAYPSFTPVAASKPARNCSLIL